MTVAASKSIQLQPELVRIKQQLLDARERARRLSEALAPSQWGTRPPSGGWSVAECLMHLNITTERYVPILDEGIRELRSRGLIAEGPLHRDIMGWMLGRMLEPPVRIKTKTPASFEPARIDPMADVMERFDYLQGELLVRLDRGSGLALDRQRIVSPFSARVRYNLYSAFSILPVHQRRHLWQAERVRSTLGA